MKLAPILIVDDDEDDRCLLQSGFKENNIETLTYKNGVEVLKYLKSNAEVLPPLIVSDYDMPLMTGLEMLQRIKADDRLKQIPVVIVSSNNPPAQVAKCLQLGAAGYHLKPHSIAKVQKLIKELLPFQKKHLPVQRQQSSG